MISALDIGLTLIILIFCYAVSKQIITAIIVAIIFYIICLTTIKDPRHAKPQFYKHIFYGRKESIHSKYKKYNDSFGIYPTNEAYVPQLPSITS